MSSFWFSTGQTQSENLAQGRASASIAIVVAIVLLLTRLLRLRSRIISSVTDPGISRSLQKSQDYCRVSAIVITLNESLQIEQCLEHLLSASPPLYECIVCDGGSNDGTVDIVRGVFSRWDRIPSCETRLKVIKCAVRGRGIQLNEAAAAASGDALVFVHADSRPPSRLVHYIHDTLFVKAGSGSANHSNLLHVDGSAPVGVGGFKTRISMFETRSVTYHPAIETKILWLTTVHEYVSYWLYPMLFRPVSFCRGLRCLWGDQNIFIRREDFLRVGGFDASLYIMEDLDLCLRVFDRLHKRIARVDGAVFGASSGRRIQAWGEIRATMIHFRISVVWYVLRLIKGVMGERGRGWSQRLLSGEYSQVYGDSCR
jgi:glycosyltransferase involved in cell wall biosynthesis